MVGFDKIVKNVLKHYPLFIDADDAENYDKLVYYLDAVVV